MTCPKKYCEVGLFVLFLFTLRIIRLQLDFSWQLRIATTAHTHHGDQVDQGGRVGRLLRSAPAAAAAASHVEAAS